MATNNCLPLLLLLLVAGSAWSREAALPADCTAAASKPPIVDAKNALAANTSDLPARFKLADAWSDAGCFGEALQALEAGQALNPRNTELDARIRVARSVLNEQTYFDRLDDAHQEAKLSRAVFRCTKLQELASCNDAVDMKPNDPTLLMAQADTLMQLKRSGEAIGVYRRIPVSAPNHDAVGGKLAAAEWLRHTQLETCASKEGDASAKACEFARLPGTSEEVVAKLPPGPKARQDLLVARKSKPSRQARRRSTAASKPVPILEEHREAVASNGDSHYSNDAPATRSN